jgi:hypothetical protein
VEKSLKGGKSQHNKRAGHLIDKDSWSTLCQRVNFISGIAVARQDVLE